jgi:hypothetical protein
LGCGVLGVNRQHEASARHNGSSSNYFFNHTSLLVNSFLKRNIKRSD